MGSAPLQNRVTPLSDVVTHPGRGLVYGNRGCLHDDHGRLRRHHNGRRWIACRLEFRGWLRRPLLQPGRFTELFFLDDATAMAAGHRACALCRRADYERLTETWRRLHPGDRGADEIDARLHAERWDATGRRRRLHDAAMAGLPDGSFVLHEGDACVIAAGRLLRWSAAGYTGDVRRPRSGRATLITPPSLVEVLRAGWRPLVPLLHPSADATSSSPPRPSAR
jgi:hypothetical protein